MTAEGIFNVLKRIPRPELRPFFAARAAARASSRPAPKRRVPAVLLAYWAIFTWFSAMQLSVHWWGIAVMIGAAGALVALESRAHEVVP